MIIREEEVVKKVFRYKMLSKEKKKLTFQLSVLGVGEFFGDNCLIGETSHYFSAVASTDCVVLCTIKYCLINLLEMYPQVNKHIIKTSQDKKMSRMNNLQNQLENYKATLQQRISMFSKGKSNKISGSKKFNMES